MPQTRDHIQLDREAVEEGYRQCAVAVKSWYQGYHWIISNQPGDKKRALNTVLHHAIRTMDLLELDSENGLSLDIWHEIRDDLSDAFLDKCTSVELAALIDTARRYSIPKEFLFNPIIGADTWIRNRQFETFDELETFASNVGGSLLAAAIPVLGIVDKAYAVPAMECGKAVFLTQLLAQSVATVKRNQVFLAQRDIEDCELDLKRLKLRQDCGKPLNYLVRLYCSRIERIFYEGGKLISFLDFDARRTITSLLATHWRMLIQMKVEPASILDDEGVLSRRDLLGLKSRHILGLEGKIPVIPVGTPDDHH